MFTRCKVRCKIRCKAGLAAEDVEVVGRRRRHHHLHANANACKAGVKLGVKQVLSGRRGRDGGPVRDSLNRRKQVQSRSKKQSLHDRIQILHD